MRVYQSELLMAAMEGAIFAGPGRARTRIFNDGEDPSRGQAEARIR
jgi:hypothetical protein